MRSVLALVLGIAIVAGQSTAAQAQSRVGDRLAKEGRSLETMSGDELLRIRSEAHDEMGEVARLRESTELKLTAATAAGLAIVGVGFATAPTFGIGCLIAAGGLLFGTVTSGYYAEVLESLDAQSSAAADVVRRVNMVFDRRASAGIGYAGERDEATIGGVPAGAGISIGAVGAGTAR